MMQGGSCVVIKKQGEGGVGGGEIVVLEAILMKL